jgi:hypothetical protein
MKGVTRVIRSKGAHRRPREWNVPLMTLGPTLKWPWRVFSVLLMGLLGGFLLAPGAAMAKTKPSLNVVVIGDPFSYGYATSANAALRQATPPTLEALNQIQTANPGVQLNTLFIPLKDATTSALNHPAGTGAYTGQSALIKSVSQASVVIVGLGAGNASLAASMRSVLFSASPSESAFSQLMTAFDNGSYLRAQGGLLSEVAGDAAPGTAIITLGYPNVKAQQHGSSLQLWSPYSWTDVSQQQANMSDQLVSALNTSNQLATSIASVQHPKLRFVFANLSSAAENIGSAGTKHVASKAKDHTASALSQSASPALIGGALLPVFDQAVNNELATKGVLGTQNVPSATPKSPWNLTVLVPLASQSQQQGQSSQQQAQSQGQSSQQQAQPQHQWSNAGVNAPPAAPKPQVSPPQAWIPPAPPSIPLLPQNNGGSGNNGQSQPSQGSPQGSSGHHHSGSQSGQPGSTGQTQPAPSTSPSTSSGQQTGTTGNQPGQPGQTGQTGQQTAAPQPTSAVQPGGSSQPAPTQSAPSSAMSHPSGNSGTTSPQQSPQPGTPSSGNLPVLPTPPAPIPEPIAPAQTPGTGGGQAPGTGTNPSAPNSPQAPTTLPMMPATPGTPTTTGSAPATPGTSTTATPGTPTTATPGTPTPATPGTPTPATPGTPTPATPGTSTPAAPSTGSAAGTTTAPSAASGQGTASASASSAGTTTSANPATPTAPTTTPTTAAPATAAPATAAPATAAPATAAPATPAAFGAPIAQAGQTSATTPGSTSTSPTGNPTWW